MLHLWIGRTGTGKTNAVYQAIGDLIKREVKKTILLVPPQSSHNTEWELAERCGDSTPLYAEALTFNTMATRIFEQGGHLQDRYLDDHGRLLLVKNARDEVSDLLTVYQGKSAKPELIKGFLNVINELKLYNVDTKELLKAAEMSEDATGNKLKDIGYLYASYDALLQGALQDPSDKYDSMLAVAARTHYYKNRQIFIDGFNGFVPKEYAVIEQMIKEAANVTLVLTVDKIDIHRQSFALFFKSGEIASRFRAFAEKENIAWDVKLFTEQYRLKPASLRFLERELIEGENSIFDGEADKGVQVVKAEDCRQECELAASQVLAWTKEGYRYRDIAVVARDLQAYSGELSSVLKGCGIPFNMDDSVSVDRKPLFVMLLAALDAVNDSFSEESMTALIKSGMTGIEEESLDILESYMLKWRIRGSKWIRPQAWRAHPEGYLRPFDEKTYETLELLESLREKLTTPLVHLKQSLKGTAQHMCQALYSYAVETELYKETKRQAELYIERGDQRTADELKQLWDIFCDTLDQFVLISGERTYHPEEFAGMFRLILTEIKVGAIPSSLDQVTVGEAGRFRSGHTKCLLVLGNNQGVFPQKVQMSSVLDDSIRLYLREKEIKLNLTTEEQQYQEQFLIYQTYFAPSDRLVLTYQKGTLQPSEYIDRILSLMPWAIQEGKIGGSIYLLRGNPQARRQPLLLPLFYSKGIRLYDEGVSIMTFPTERLSPTLVPILYGEPLRMSPSGIERFHTCKFSFFVQYGLGVRDFRCADFEAAEAGEFVHYVFENLGKFAREEGGFKAIDQETVLIKTEQYAHDFYDSIFDAEECRTRRTDYLFSRLTHDVKELAMRMYKELSVSTFEPYLFEQTFGKKETPPILYTFSEGNLAINGRLDRADKATVKGKDFIRLVDYKTGAKDFNFTDLYNGINAQLPLYLFYLTKEKYQPAAFFYMPSQSEPASLPRHATEEEIHQEKRKNSHYKGLMLNEPEVMLAMDPQCQTDNSMLPTKLKNGRPERGDYTITESEFQSIRIHMEGLLRKMNKELREGRIAPDPYVSGSRSGCDYCRYQSICRIYPENQNSEERELKSLRCKDFLEKIKSKEGEPCN